MNRYRHRRRIVRPAVILGVWLVVAFGVVGCSLSETAPEAAADAPAELFATTSTPVTNPAEPTTMLPLYFIDDGTNTLVRVDRPGDSGPTIGDVVRAIIEQPLEAEKTDHPGIASRFPSYDTLEPTAEGPSADGVLTVTMSGTEMSDVAVNNAQRVNLAYSQIVCTMVALSSPEIDWVLLRDDKGDIPFRSAGSETVVRPVGPSDVNDCRTGAELAALQAPESTTTTGPTTTLAPTRSPN